MVKHSKKIAGLLGAAALTLALAGPAMADVKWAVPVDHYASSGGDGSNEGAFWVAYLNDKFDAGLSEGDCEKLSESAFNDVNNGDGSADLGTAYGWVIVKQASSAAVDFDNTVFKDVAADETVFADTDGDGVYGEGDSQGISHILVCVPGEEETAPPTEEVTAPPTEEPSTPADTEVPSFEQSVGADTDAPTEPNTATIGNSSTSAPSDGAWLLVVALGVLLAGVVVMTPARAKSKR